MVLIRIGDTVKTSIMPHMVAPDTCLSCSRVPDTWCEDSRCPTTPVGAGHKIKQSQGTSILSKAQTHRICSAIEVYQIHKRALSHVRVRLLSIQRLETINSAETQSKTPIDFTATRCFLILFIPTVDLNINISPNRNNPPSVETTVVPLHFRQS